MIACTHTRIFCRPISLLAIAACTLLSNISTDVDAQIISAIYQCTDTDFLACDAELKTCLSNRLSRDSVMVTCESCYKMAWQCYDDCKKVAPTFPKACVDACSPLYADACAPAQYKFTAARAGSIEIGKAASAAVGVVTAAVALQGGAG